MFTFTPLLGAQSGSAASQSILELDGGIKVLIDVGWNEDFDAGILKELEKQVSTLSFILLTHATTAHLGAFAHCCKHITLFARIPVYATEPVIALGRSLLQDIYTSTPLAASVLSAASLSENVYSYPTNRDANSSILLPPPSQIEIAGYFSAIRSLKYSQPFEPTPSSFSPPLNGLSITAYSAGRTLGGTIWHIQHGQESIVHAVDWSQAREHVLAGAAWIDPNQPTEVIESLRRPTALICSSRGSQRIALTGGQKRRDDILLDLIKDTIAKGGTVLLPSDSSARVLELVYLLENAWAQAFNDKDNALNNAKLYFASSSGKSTTHNARRMLEWMDPNVQRQFENQANAGGRGQTAKDAGKAGNAPFDFAFTKTLERKTQLSRALGRNGPKVIVASDSSLQWGLSRPVLESIATDEKNLIILTERSTAVSQATSGFGKLLWDVWSRRAGVADYDFVSQDPPSQAFAAGGAQVSSKSSKIEPLAGNELNVYQQYLARQRQMQDTVNTEEPTTVIANVDAAEARSETSSESEDEDDDEQQGKLLNATATMTGGKHKIGLTDAELGIDVLIRRKGHYDYDIRGKRGRERMFPILKKGNQRDDEYGDTIKPEDYLRAEERDAMNDDEATGTNTRKDTGVGAKRKWDEVNVEAVQAARKQTGGTAKRKRIDDSQAMDGLQTNGAVDSDEDESDEEMEEKVEGPVKAVFGETTLTLALRIAFVDFSGYHDKRSILHLIPLIKPRKLILVGGDAKETAALSTDCEQVLHLEPGNDDIYTPINGDTVDASVDTNAWTVKLTQPLYKKLRWQNVRGLGVVALSAFLLPPVSAEIEDEEASSKKLKLTNGEPPVQSSPDIGFTGLPLLDVFTTGMVASALSRTAAQPIHVGDIRLADLRRALQAEQYTAEFRGEGLLVINNSVAVRKSAMGRLEVEGLLGLNTMGRPDPTFYNTRRKVYDMLAMVSGA
jgi:cleavage and polyadenylation specificity factor subunit 2